MDNNGNVQNDQDNNNNKVKKLKGKRKPSHITELQSILTNSALRRLYEAQRPGIKIPRIQIQELPFSFRSFLKESMLSPHAKSGKFFKVNSSFTQRQQIEHPRTLEDDDDEDSQDDDDDNERSLQGIEVRNLRMPSNQNFAVFEGQQFGTIKNNYDATNALQSNINRSDENNPRRANSSDNTNNNNNNNNNNENRNSSNQRDRKGNSNSSFSSSPSGTYTEVSSWSSRSSSSSTDLSETSQKPLDADNRRQRRKTLLTDRGEIGFDQLYITDSVGRAGCKTRGYMLPPPGQFIVTRNPSDIKLKYIKRLGNVNNTKIDQYVWVIKVCGILMMISGILLFFFVMSLSINASIKDYLRDYMIHQRITFIFILGGVIQTFVIGVYCLFTLTKLSHMRPYFLRIPFTLLFPMGFFICAIKFTYEISDKTETYLKSHMESYKDSTENRWIWDGLQDYFSCCGINHNSEWKSHLNVAGQPSYPKSCCINQDEPGCPSFALPSSMYPIGCLHQVQKLNVGFGTFFIIISTVQLVLELVSVVFMKMLYDVIKSEIDDNRSNCKILLGKCYSICDSVEYDKQQELAELGQLQFQDITRTLPEYSYSSQTRVV